MLELPALVVEDDNKETTANGKTCKMKSCRDKRCMAMACARRCRGSELDETVDLQ
jgi:hypothetical protein